MARVTLSSQVATLTSQVADLQRELELTKRQLQDAMTEKGALLNQLAVQEPSIPQAFQEAHATLVDEHKQLIAENQRLVESCIAAHERCAILEAIVAASPKSAPPAPKKPAPKPQVPVSEIESQPVIQLTDEDRRLWTAFKALPRERRNAYYEFAHTTVGHLGIDNIRAVREAYLAKQAS